MAAVKHMLRSVESSRRTGDPASGRSAPARGCALLSDYVIDPTLLCYYIPHRYGETQPKNTIPMTRLSRWVNFDLYTYRFVRNLGNGCKRIGNPENRYVMKGAAPAARRARRPARNERALSELSDELIKAPMVTREARRRTPCPRLNN
ncbi:hypothetical protein EVAR_25707_1 [Eumeta japonica]|uniref:Uncharacterized protein n=1 Tax=Eumeta variegata TaxID=151549 RepID=A0A4C1YPI1_EUMVA|nr:hypothetical protein EVAR_25707_1 [Eumeta japonica]